MAGINMGNATPGLTRLAAAIGGGPGSAYQNAYDHELKLESSIAQALAAQEASRAQARLHNLQSDELQQQSAARKPEAILGSALTTYGIPQQDAPAVSEYLKTGQLGGKYRMPEDGMGPVAPAPDYAPQLGSVARTIGTMNQALTLGDKNIHNVSQAEEQRRVSGNAQGVLNGTVDPTTFAQSQYAVKGNAPYAFHEFGVGNNLTGAVDATGAPAQNFAQYRQAETGNQKAGARAHDASAASSYASAAHSRALTAKTTEETNQLKTAPKGVLVQTDNGPVFADPRSGQSVPVKNPDGTPAAPKLKEIPAAQNHAFIENAKALQNIDAAMDAVYRATGIKLDANGNPVRDPNAKPMDENALGARNYLGEGLRQRTDPGGVTVRAQVANIGGQKYHDISGAAVSAGEAARLAPFIPHATDSPGAVLQKLANLRREYQNVNDMLQQSYSRDQGYRPSPAAVSGKPRSGGTGGVVDFHQLPSTPSAPATGGAIDFGSLR